MQINIPDPFFQTNLFTIALLLITLLSSKKDTHPHEMNRDHTNQLKGLAIMMVIFSHIGYFLDSQDKFLYPLSVAGGVGVNIFLFLSGFGLTFSTLKSHTSILGFYFKRLSRIYFPLWLAVSLFLILDFFILQVNYPTRTIIYNFFGFIPDADIYTSFNSPLWYFTLILFYYLIFPLFFWKKAPILSAVLILVFSLFLIRLNLPVVPDVLKLYKLHILAFPLGIIFAVLQNGKYKITDLIKNTNPTLRYVLTLLLILSISYTAIHSGVGEATRVEQFISLITMISFIFVVLFLPFKSKFLITLGIYSYEIYLIQWPLLYRYDFLYKFFPASFSTLFYIIIFILIGFCLKNVSSSFLKLKSD